MRVKVYDERTGDPRRDTGARLKNRAVNRTCRGQLRVSTPRGRRRKKAIMSAEFPRYVRLVALLADELRKRDGR